MNRTKSEPVKSAGRLPPKLASYLALPRIDPMQRYSLDETTLYLRQSLTKTRQCIADGRLRAIKDGGRVYVSGAEIARFSTEGRAEAAAA